MPESIELDPETCQRLLRADVVGRVAICTATGPHVVPVNYAVVDEFVVFRTTPYSVLGSSGRNSLLAFEIDHLDHDRQHCWSVVARGRCQWVEDMETIAAWEATLGPRPWAAGSRHLYLRLPLTDVTGRKLGLHWNPLDELPVRRAAVTESP
ncbi:MAG: pyridoxamine 5-phosphate oxidase-related, FMN-binding protein [Nocardioidaceae bacterium]|nr:pyridoxamine 5-phosphate oxidase-related, FMN-binding protein [Nocardioidaceae bacterium]